MTGLFRGKSLRRLSAAFTFALLFAFVSVAFVHRPVPPGTAGSDVDVSAYVLPDGSIPFICSGVGQSGDEDGAPVRHCPFCTLCKILTLPAPLKASLPTSLTMTVVFADRRSPLHLRETGGGFWSRAPPLTA